MFAVAVWDAPRRRLVLARDRVGKKPLYYLHRNGELLFGSETKAILAALPEVPGVNAGALLEFFTFGYVAGSQAVFDGMQRLMPGTALIVDQQAATVRSEVFWRWPEPPERDAMSEADATERLRAELTEAVRIRMRSDVPLGAFLSGGMARTVAMIAGGGIEMVRWPALAERIETGDFVADIGLIRRELGWEPKVPLAEGLERTVAFYRAHAA